MIARERHIGSASGLLFASSLVGMLLLLFSASAALCSQPPPASGGQDSGSKPQDSVAVDDRLVSLDAERSRLVDIIPDLMKSVGAEFSLDSSIKYSLVTLHISKAKLKDTLEALLRTADVPVTYRVEKGLYHIMSTADAPRVPRTPSGGSSGSSAPARRGPLYNGGDPISVAVSELYQFLSGSEPALSGKGPYPNNGPTKAGTHSISGSRSFAEYGFLNGRLSSSSYSTPDMSNPQDSSFGGGYGYFGPMGRGNGIIR